MKYNKFIFPVFVVMLLIIGGYYLLSGNRNGLSPPVIGGGTTSLSNQSGPVKTFEISGRSYSFTPNEIKVKKGDNVKIIFTNTEGFHDLQIEGYGVGTSQIPANQSDTIDFVANKSGTFQFYCSVSDHRQRGMIGSLIVED